MGIHYILDAELHFYYLFGVFENSNIAMKKIINEMKDVARITLIFLIVLSFVKLFGWMFKTIFN